MYHYSDVKKIREDAEIIYIMPIGEGSRKNKRIRTSVVFDDGFEYSACKYGPGGLFTIEATKNDQLEVAAEAIKKHNKLVAKLKAKGQLTPHPYELLTDHQIEIVEFACSIINLEIKTNEKDCISAQKNKELKNKIKRLRMGDESLINECSKQYDWYKKNDTGRGCGTYIYEMRTEHKKGNIQEEHNSENKEIASDKKLLKWLIVIVAVIIILSFWLDK